MRDINPDSEEYRGVLVYLDYNEPIKQDKELKKISDLDIMKIRKKK